MPKIQYKAKDGILHIGGGRFFNAQEPVEVTDQERDDLLKAYKDLEEVSETVEKSLETPKQPETDETDQQEKTQKKTTAK